TAGDCSGAASTKLDTMLRCSTATKLVREGPAKTRHAIKLYHVMLVMSHLAQSGHRAAEWHFTDAWLAKLRSDQRAAGAALVVLVSTALPKGVESFAYVDGVWVTDFRFAVPLAVALRQSLIEIAALRQAHEGQETKMELVYQYLTSPKFRHRVQAIVEKISE